MDSLQLVDVSQNRLVTQFGMGLGFRVVKPFARVLRFFGKTHRLLRGIATFHAIGHIKP